MNRRAFCTALGLTAVSRELSAGVRVFGVCRLRRYAGSGLSLPAVAAACMPESLVIEHAGQGTPMRGSADAMERIARAGYVEFRRYRQEFSWHGCEIRPILKGENGALLFAFDTLASREKAWRELSSRREWLRLEAKLEELAIYRGCGGP